LRYGQLVMVVVVDGRPLTHSLTPSLGDTSLVLALAGQ